MCLSRLVETKFKYKFGYTVCRKFDDELLTNFRKEPVVLGKWANADTTELLHTEEGYPYWSGFHMISSLKEAIKFCRNRAEYAYDIHFCIVLCAVEDVTVVGAQRNPRSAFHNGCSVPDDFVRTFVCSKRKPLKIVHERNYYD